MRSLSLVLLLAACGRHTTAHVDGGASDLAVLADGATGDASHLPGKDGGTPTSFPAGTICNETGEGIVAPTVLKHLIVILEENENFGTVNGNAAAPYVSLLAGKCAQATNYADNCFPDNLYSLPHYLALTSGSNCDVGLDKGGTACIRDDADPTSHTLSTPSIFAQVTSWKSYQEGMQSACAQSSSGKYACKHNPAAYYSALSTCAADDVAIPAITCSSSAKMTACSSPQNTFTDDLANDTLPAFSFVTPNLDNDMHDGTVTQADNWLYTYLPLVFASPAYLRGEVAVLVPQVPSRHDAPPSVSPQRCPQM